MAQVSNYREGNVAVTPAPQFAKCLNIVGSLFFASTTLPILEQLPPKRNGKSMGTVARPLPITIRFFLLSS